MRKGAAALITSQKRKKLALGVGPTGSNFRFCEEAEPGKGLHDMYDCFSRQARHVTSSLSGMVGIAFLIRTDGAQNPLSKGRRRSKRVGKRL